MNIHPAIVHFPVALLTLYAILELIPVRLYTKSSWSWVHPVKVFLLFFGVVFAKIALLTGETLEHAVRQNVPQILYLVERHSFFANITITIFGLLALAYLFELSFVKRLRIKFPKWIEYIISVYLKIFCRPVRVLLALGGLIAVSITGALGGSLAYGFSNDPFTAFVYHLFFK